MVRAPGEFIRIDHNQEDNSLSRLMGPSAFFCSILNGVHIYVYLFSRFRSSKRPYCYGKPQSHPLHHYEHADLEDLLASKDLSIYTVRRINHTADKDPRRS